MIKCERCGYTNEKAKGPMICPQCGNIAKPFVVVKKKKENVTENKTEEVNEAVMLEKLID